VEEGEEVTAADVIAGTAKWSAECSDALEWLRALPDGIARTCVTSPPYYGLRNYGSAGQIGLEATTTEYVARLVDVFREVRRVLADDGTLWLNLGDSYAGSWGAQARGAAPSAKSTLEGNGHRGGGPKIKSISSVQIANHPRLKKTGSLSRFPGCKAKDLAGIPWMVAFALRADGWYLRQDIIWSKPNTMPESVKDRCTEAHEYLFLLSKRKRYYYDAAAIDEPATGEGGGACFGKQGHDTNGTGAQHRQYERPDYETRNRRSVWTVTTKPYKGAHFATFPPDLIEPCIKAGSAADDIVLEPFTGSGTTLAVAVGLGRRAIGCELNPDYLELIERRLATVTPCLEGFA
jgi:DNA modification methylase